MRSPEPELGRGVLHPGAAAARIRLTRFSPAPAVARFVEDYWLVRWELRGRPPHDQKVLSHPHVHLVFEHPGPRVYGVDRGLFVRRLEGAGHVLGVKFRVGGYRPFADGPVSALADRSVPAAGRFGAEVVRTAEAVLAEPGGAAMAALADAFLLGVLPEPDPLAEEAAAMVERITRSPEVFRVDLLAAELGVPVRRMQRLFAEYVGASPKWVLRRARLHEAATRAGAGAPVDWAELAAELGYADQAHLTRDFTAAVGTPPARYADGARRA